MSEHLVVSRPPHPDAHPDAVGRLLGLAVYEASQFLKFPYPDILRVAPDRGSAEDAARGLADVGVAVEVVDHAGLSGLSAPALAESFGFADDGMLFVFEHEERWLPCSTFQRLLVWRLIETPRSTGTAPAGARTNRGIGTAAASLCFNACVGNIHGMVSMLRKARAAARGATRTQKPSSVEKHVADLLAWDGSSLGRIRLDQRHLDYTGLGDAMRPETHANWSLLLEELGRLAPGMEVDDSLLRFRTPPTTGKHLKVENVQQSAGLKPYLMDYPSFLSALDARDLSVRLAAGASAESARAGIGDAESR